jgi:hypothetical protein
MIEIKHNTTGEVLHRVDADNLIGADLADLKLSNADLFDAKLVSANLLNTDLTYAILSFADLLYLDTHIFSDEVIEDAREKVRSGEWKENWRHHLRKYQAANFTHWQDPTAYQKSLDKLLHDLKQPPPR